MIRLGLRMALGTGRDALLRLAVIAAAVALGVGMLLATLAALNATGTQNARNGWLNTGRVPAQAQPGADPLWWRIGADGFQGKLVGRVDVAATGPHSPVPPGMPRLPGPGEFYASPAMAELLRDTPAAQLADRYPGTLAGIIGKAALPGPGSLVIVVGHRPDELAGQRDATEVTAITSSSPSSCSGPSCAVGTNDNGMKLVLSVVAAAMIFPVLVLIGTATRLSAAAREQRFAAMRLVGATPRQIAVVSTVESTVAAAAGVAVGFGLFAALRPLLVRVDFTRTPFYLSDLSLSAADIAVVAVGVPLAAAVSARLALRRVRISPLGVTRRTTPRPPRAYRLIPLVAGLVELACFIGHRPATSTGQVRAFLPGILVVLGGLVVAGPWLTMAGARLMAGRARRPAGLVAGRRLSDDPKAGFRAVSGLVLALCVTTTAVGIIDAIVHERGLPGVGKTVRDTVASDHRDFADGRTVGTAATPPDSVLAALRAVPGVGGVLVVHADPTGGDRRVPFSGGLVDCAQLAATPVYGACPPGARTASFTTGVDSYGLGDRGPWPSRWPAATTTPDELRALPVVQVAVTTDGSRAAVETARTLLARAYPADDPPYTVAEDRAAKSQALDSYRRLADVVIAVSFPIAGCSLAVAVAGGIGDRKRPFSLLRLTGVRLRTLRQVVLLESTVPLLAVAVVAIGTGFLAAQLFLKAQLDYALQPPGAGYYSMVAGGIAAALAVIGATLPLLKRVTGPENARNE
ncbi:FtsX-like permease family protein [Streptomyces sp. NPDC021020]|uniref:FtsX-like permease family protein n=1 Tax=Streptomyces sp. NPDC021020 TaxID=3365109 RepID=UPI0037A47A82